MAAERSCDSLIYMHNDAEAAPGTPERFLATLEEAVAAGRRWGVAFTRYDTLAAVSMTLGNVLALLQNKSVQEELKLDKDQVGQAGKALQELMKKNGLDDPAKVKSMRRSASCVCFAPPARRRGGVLRLSRG